MDQEPFDEDLKPKLPSNPDFFTKVPKEGDIIHLYYVCVV